MENIHYPEVISLIKERIANLRNIDIPLMITNLIYVYNDIVKAVGKSNIKEIQHQMLYALSTDQFKKASRISFEFTIQYMDLYLLSRMFRTFKEGIKRRYRGEANNVLIYVGDLHATNYRRVLSELEFTEVFSSYARKGEEKFQCLDITGLDQPLFI